MPPNKRRIKRKKKRNTKHHIALILFLIAVAVFFFFEKFGKEDLIDTPSDVSRSEKKDVFSPVEKPIIVPPLVTLSPKLPMIAIVMDDLGNHKKNAEDVLNIKAPLTFSILPRRRYSAWIAEEGHRLGRDILVHQPMEATRPLKLGEGGLILKMTDTEIITVLNKNIQSVPYRIGVSNHMGSAFTQNERAMNIVVSELKKEGLFFLDSITTPESVGFKIAKEKGIKALRRDVFLDNTDDPVEIMVQWKRLLKIAEKNGSAIALAHPRKNTLEFLRKTVENNKEVEVVPLSALIID